MDENEDSQNQIADADTAGIDNLVSDQVESVLQDAGISTSSLANIQDSVDDAGMANNDDEQWRVPGDEDFGVFDEDYQDSQVSILSQKSLAYISDDIPIGSGNHYYGVREVYNFHKFLDQQMLMCDLTAGRVMSAAWALLYETGTPGATGTPAPGLLDTTGVTFGLANGVAPNTIKINFQYRPFVISKGRGDLQAAVSSSTSDFTIPYSNNSSNVSGGNISNEIIDWNSVNGPKHYQLADFVGDQHSGTQYAGKQAGGAYLLLKDCAGSASGEPGVADASRNAMSGQIGDGGGNISILPDTRTLNSGTTAYLDWGNKILSDGTKNSLEWSIRQADDSSGNAVFNWQTLGQLTVVAGATVKLFNTAESSGTGTGSLQLDGGFYFAGASSGAKSGCGVDFLQVATAAHFNFLTTSEVNLADNGGNAVDAKVGPINANVTSGFSVGGTHGTSVLGAFTNGIITGTASLKSYKDLQDADKVLVF